MGFYSVIDRDASEQLGGLESSVACFGMRRWSQEAVCKVTDAGSVKIHRFACDR